MPKPRDLRLDSTRGEVIQPTISRSAALRAIGEVVYAIRTSEGTIKIGHTRNLDMRRYQVGSVEVLAFQPGTFDDEQRIHAGLVDQRHHGREWYNPTPEVLAVVNDMRQRIGLDHLAA
jgi:hypothetical protein